MPARKKPRDLFAGIRQKSTDRPPPRDRKIGTPAEGIVDNGKMVTIALTMPRALFERYNAGKSRGRFRDEMVRQLEKKFG